MSLRFQLFGIPVGLHPSFFLTALLLAWHRLEEPVLLVTWILVVTLSVLFHELGHAVAYRGFGHAPEIDLYGMGGFTGSSTRATLRPLQDVVVCLAGPAFGFLAAGVVFAMMKWVPYPPSPVGRVVLRDLLWVNGFWGLVNLLPMLPLDGGQALRSLLRHRWRDRAETPSLLISATVAAAALLWAIGAREWWVGLLSGSFLVANVSSLRQRRQALEQAAVVPFLEEARIAYEAGDGAKAAAAARAGLEAARSAAWRDRARTLLILARLKQGDADGARAVVAEMRAYAVDAELLRILEAAFREAGLTKEADETGRLLAARRPVSSGDETGIAR